MVDRLHDSLSYRLRSTADWLDSFFADENYIAEYNRSYVRVRYDIFREQGTGVNAKPAIDLRLALPAFEKKTHLVLSIDPADQPKTVDAPLQTAAERFGAPEQRNVTTAFDYFFRATMQENLMARVGVQFSQGAPSAYIAPRYRYQMPLDGWEGKFMQEPLWRTDSGWQSDTRLDAERLLTRDILFRTTLDGIWAARSRGYLCELSFLLRHMLTEKQAINYEWINSYKTRPTGAWTETAFRVRYRRGFWKGWLFYEISPQIRYSREHNFDAMPGILFRLDAFFGEQR